MICHLYPEPSYFIFSSDVPELLYYSHIPTAIISLLIGIFILTRGPKILINQILFGISSLFAIWTFINLVAWVNIESNTILFLWSLFGILFGLISILCISFIYVFVNKRALPSSIKTVFILLLLPIFLFAASDLNLKGFNISDCDAFGFEGVLYSAYYTLLGIVAMIWIFFIIMLAYRKTDSVSKRKILYMGMGIELFLFSFFVIIFLASYLSGLGVLKDSSIEMYGLFGMLIFMGFLSHNIVEFKTFNVGLIASQALVIALIALVASQFFFVDTSTAFALTAITTFLAIGFGFFLVKSVKREVKQREQIEQLASGLEQANDQLKVLDKMKSEFVSIASHQLRSPLTAIRGYSSMLLEGSFGPLPQKAKEAIDHINESSRFMASSVEDYLNVSRIQAGNMKYEYSDFNVCDLASRVADDTRAVALKKGLLLTFKSDMHKKGIVHADIGKTRQVIDNLINNSLKYTPKGSINILVYDDVKQKKVFVDVSDTGIGMNPRTLDNMFGKFERASNANEVNVTGTGLGLYIARKMAREMGGDVYATSEGEGKGSTFTIELPLMM